MFDEGGKSSYLFCHHLWNPSPQSSLSFCESEMEKSRRKKWQNPFSASSEIRTKLFLCIEKAAKKSNLIGKPEMKTPVISVLIFPFSFSTFLHLALLLCFKAGDLFSIFFLLFCSRQSKWFCIANFRINRTTFMSYQSCIHQSVIISLLMLLSFRYNLFNSLTFIFSCIHLI